MDKKEQGIPVINVFLVEKDGKQLVTCGVNPDLEPELLFNALGTACKMIGNTLKMRREEKESKIVEPSAADIININKG
jgi:hypothetical protein